MSAEKRKPEPSVITKISDRETDHSIPIADLVSSTEAQELPPHEIIIEQGDIALVHIKRSWGYETTQIFLPTGTRLAYQPNLDYYLTEINRQEIIIQTWTVNQLVNAGATKYQGRAEQQVFRKTSDLWLNTSSSFSLSPQLAEYLAERANIPVSAGNRIELISVTDNSIIIEVNNQIMSLNATQVNLDSVKAAIRDQQNITQATIDYPPRIIEYSPERYGGICLVPIYVFIYFFGLSIVLDFISNRKKNET